MLQKCLLVVGAFLCYMIADGATYSFGVLYIALLDEFQQPKAVTAFVGALMMGLPQISAPLVCSYVGAFGARASAFTAGFLLAIAFFVTRFAWTVQFLYISVGLIASLGLELAYVAALIAVEKGFSKKLALATGITVSGSGFGMCLFAPLVEFLIAEYGWRNACMVLAAVCLNLCVSASLFMQPNTKPAAAAATAQELQRLDGHERDTSSADPHDQVKVDADATRNDCCLASCSSKCGQLCADFCQAVRGMFNSSIYTLRFMRFCMANFVVAATVLVPLTFVVHKAEVSGVEPQYAAFLLSFAGLSSSAGQIIIGLVATNWCKPLYVYVAALSISGCMIVALAFAKSFALFAVLCAVFGFTYGAYYALMSVMLVDYVSHDLFTPALAIYALFQGVGDLVACPLVGLTFDMTESYDVVFIAAGAALTLSIIAFLLPDIIRSNKPRKDESCHTESA